MAEAQAWISAAEAAQVLEISERTVRRRCAAGTLQCRLEKTDSGKTWMVCLSPAKDETKAESSVQKSQTSTRDEKAVAIVATGETVESITTINAEILEQVSAVKHQIEEIKNQMASEFFDHISERLSNLPTRDQLRDDTTEIISSTLLPVIQRLEELSAINAQLETELHQEKQRSLANVCRPWWKRLFS